MMIVGKDVLTSEVCWSRPLRGREAGGGENGGPGTTAASLPASAAFRGNAASPFCAANCAAAAYGAVMPVCTMCCNRE